MTMEMFVIGVVLVALGVAIGAILMSLFGRQAALEKRISALEDCKQKRLPYNTAAGVEDGLAVGLDLLRNSAEAELELGALRQRAEKLMEILRAVRGGPENYDPEKPAGKR